MLTAPKTTGAYVPARLAECFSSGVCSSRDMERSTFARFTKTTLEANWVMESETVPWRMTKNGPEVGDSSGPNWQPLEWQELPDGSVRTTAMRRGGSETLRWVPESLEELGKRWSRAWTQAQLARLAGTWGSGKAAVSIGPRGIELKGTKGTWKPLVARPCIERCEGSIPRVCLEDTERVTWWVVRDNGLEAVTPGDQCADDDGFVDAFEPRGEVLARAKADEPVSATGVSADSLAKAVRQKVQTRLCHEGKTLTANIELTVASTGLPTAAVVKGVPSKTERCVQGLLWSLALPPAPLGAPATAIKVVAELPGE